jgi:hypothetical protein
VKRLLRKALVVFLLAWLPLQAGALPALVLDCELDPEGSAMHQAMHGGAQHDHGHDTAADGDQAPAHDHDGDAGHDAFSHGCCHNLSSGAAAAAPIVSLPAGAIVPAALAIHPYRFFPELLKRPPLADLV